MDRMAGSTKMTKQIVDSVADANVAIRVANLSKVFQVYDTPGDRLKQFLLPRWQRLVGLNPGQYFNEFWAVRNLSFTVNRGEVVGIVGRNGAGKSTLLQIISGTLNQSAGEVETHGKIAALLELGSGFNPEFTGRENIYLNGSILGLTKEEIDRRFGEIADFADIGDFLEQPVKTYSSGMYVRLAFAVQACIDPDILIVDEALSVGDIGFQYKCFRRMEALRESGTTILIVTHATGTVLEYADRCIVLDHGEIMQDTTDVLSAVLTYEKGMLLQRDALPTKIAATQFGKISSCEELQALRTKDCKVELDERRFGSARAIIESLRITKADGVALEDHPIVKPGEELIFTFRLLAAERLNDVVLGVSLSKSQGPDVWGDNNLAAGHPMSLEPGACWVEYRACLPVSSGEYLVHCGLACFTGDQREELDQRRPIAKLRFWSTRDQVGVVYAPIRVATSRESHP